MASLTTNTTLKGNGFAFNVRSGKLERVIDFTKFDFAKTTYFEIGDLPTGFLPRAIAILELKKQSDDETAATFGVYLKGDSSKLVERALGTAVGNTFALLTGAATTGSAAPFTTALSPKAVGGTLCAYASNKPSTGLVKVVIAGDMMSGEWDEGLKRDAFDPAEHVKTPAIG